MYDDYYTDDVREDYYPEDDLSMDLEDWDGDNHDDDVDEQQEMEDFEQTDEYFGCYGEDQHLDGMYEE